VVRSKLFSAIREETLNKCVCVPLVLYIRSSRRRVHGNNGVHTSAEKIYESSNVYQFRTDPTSIVRVLLEAERTRFPDTVGEVRSFVGEFTR